MNKKFFTLIFVILTALGITSTVYAHGAKIDYTINMGVEIQAAYDSGEPMAEAQVIIYAPNDPATPWLKGVTDRQGRFNFIPDPTLPGTWDVQVRQSGHGDIVHIPIGENTALAGGTGFTPLQIGLMTVCVVWGFVGTGLYYSARRKT